MSLGLMFTLLLDIEKEMLLTFIWMFLFESLFDSDVASMSNRACSSSNISVELVEVGMVAATGTFYTGETSGTLGVVVDITDVGNDKDGGHFENGLLGTECEALFLGN
jgi:hypothetical protein